MPKSENGRLVALCWDWKYKLFVEFRGNTAKFGPPDPVVFWIEKVFCIRKQVPNGNSYAGGRWTATPNVSDNVNDPFW